MSLEIGGSRMRAIQTPSSSLGASRLRRMSATQPSSDHKTVNVKIRGKVQGVFYRNWTVDTANQLGLNGWVRNKRDGSVEAVFSGKSSTVDAMIQKCHSGPPAARVTGIETSAWTGSVNEGFERRTTE